MDREQAHPVVMLDGQGFRRLVEAGMHWLRQHQAAINALNVFPVPDGDTGTNMLLTMQSAWAEIAHCDEAKIGAVAHKVAHGALMGARGNSGVILSQIWRGFARALDDQERMTAADLARAMQEAADTAYKGVIRPVEGTILTVVREVAEAARAAAVRYQDITQVFAHMVSRGREAVARTPLLLPVLAEAGVVDAGGQGLFVILEGMWNALRGERIEAEEPVEAGEAISPAFQAEEVPEAGEAGYGYDVQFILVGHDLDVDRIRADIDAMGDSTLVVGDANTVKVHVHVHDPGVPLSYAVRWGSLRDVVVEDMQAQYESFVQERDQEQSAPLAAAPAPERPEALVDVVSVAPGEGLARVFESLGVGAVVAGGQTMNPSTQELLEAIEAVPAPQVILLPNNGNVIMAARQAAALASKEVAVVPSRTIPQGIAALLAFNPQADLDTNLPAMEAAMEEVTTGEITTATRSVEMNGVTVAAGQVIGLVDDQLAAAGDRIEEVIWVTLEKMNAAEQEVITLYYGDDVSQEEAEALAEAIRQRYPEQEVEVIEGGQPHYHYILSVE